MSLVPLFADGFELYTSTSSLSGAGIITLWNNTAVTGLFGTGWGRFGSTGYLVQATLPIVALSTGTGVVGMMAALLQPSPTAAHTVFAILDAAGTVQGRLMLNIDGSISVQRGAGTATLATSAAGAFSAGAFNHIEAQCKVDPTTGTWDVWVNGVSVLSASGLNTRGSAVVGSNAASMQIGHQNVSQQWDDVVFYNATSRTGATGGTFEHYGDKTVQTSWPTGDGTGDVGVFTVVGASAAAAVSEAPQNGNTSYIADSVVGHIKSFVMSDLRAGTTGIVAVFPTVCFEKDDATARAIAVGQRTSSTNAFGANISSPSTYAYSQQVMQTDGAGGALSVAGYNGTEGLIEIAV